MNIMNTSSGSHYHIGSYDSLNPTSIEIEELENDIIKLNEVISYGVPIIKWSNDNDNAMVDNANGNASNGNAFHKAQQQNVNGDIDDRGRKKGGKGGKNGGTKTSTSVPQTFLIDVVDRVLRKCLFDRFEVRLDGGLERSDSSIMHICLRKIRPFNSSLRSSPYITYNLFPLSLRSLYDPGNELQANSNGVQLQPEDVQE